MGVSFTVTGAGGSGKTRLALQVAAELVADARGGVIFVPSRRFKSRRSSPRRSRSPPECAS